MSTPFSRHILDFHRAMERHRQTLVDPSPTPPPPDTCSRQPPSSTVLTEGSRVCGLPVVINLESDVQRLADLRRHFSDAWGVDVVRHPAVGVDAVKKRVKFDGNRMRPYAYALNVSTADAIHSFLADSSADNLLLLEDDCRFVEDPRVVVETTLRDVTLLDSAWSVVSLGAYSKNMSDVDRSVVSYEQPVSWDPLGTHAVLVSRRGAERYAAALMEFTAPPDALLFTEYRKTRRGYLRRPSAAYQEEYVSHKNGKTYDTRRTADVDKATMKKILNGNFR